MCVVLFWSPSRRESCCVARSSWKLKMVWDRSFKEIYQTAGVVSLRVGAEINVPKKLLL